MRQFFSSFVYLIQIPGFISRSDSSVLEYEICKLKRVTQECSWIGMPDLEFRNWMHLCSTFSTEFSDDLVVTNITTYRNGEIIGGEKKTFFLPAA